MVTFRTLKNTMVDKSRTSLLWVAGSSIKVCLLSKLAVLFIMITRGIDIWIK